ncbi:MAG: hypothetical protein AAB225_17370 [Acidobacteriota bacterium]
MEIDREHPEYTARKAMWQAYRDLYAGGEQFRANATQYLIGRQKEPLTVFNERLARVFYENYIGSIIDWYAATLFRREPILSFEGEDETGKRFFRAFAEDCDRKGTALSDFFRPLLTEALVCGSAAVVVDFPRFKSPAGNRAEEEASGVSRAYLVRYGADELVNWSHDDEGNYEWVVLRTSSERRLRPGDAEPVKETRWIYYDKEQYKIYRAVRRKDKTTRPEPVDEGRHGLAGLGRVPLLELRVSEGLWLMNKAALLQLEHFNKSNALGWALTMGLFAMPVVYSERDFKQVVGESYYIQLGPEDRFGWTEPEGHVYQIAADNLVRLKDEIYRVCYLMTQAGGGLAAGTPQSGLSKQRDFTITQEVLRAYGDVVKDMLKRVLRTVAQARQDAVTVHVSGLDEFDIGDFSSELEDARKLLDMNIESPTLRKQVLKKLAFKYLCDVRQEVKDQIAAEIEEGVAAEKEGE